MKFLPLLIAFTLPASAASIPSPAPSTLKAPPGKPPAITGDFPTACGTPTSVATDASQVYLGWLPCTSDAPSIIACDPAGSILWTVLPTHISVCRALAADAGALYVLGEAPTPKPVNSSGAIFGSFVPSGTEYLFKLNPRDGSSIPWPDGRTAISITSLWPAKNKYKPARADYMAVKGGRIFLSFTSGQFVALLDAISGAYLQTVVGEHPGPIDSTATRSDSASDPGKLIDADFLVTAIKGAGLGKLLLAHDPIWVLASELATLDAVDADITALTVLGDSAPHHMHDIFLALGAPSYTIQARSALDTDTVSYTAGQPGGRLARGPWQPNRIGEIASIALDSTGHLWIVESDTVPGRISVWSTDKPQGELLREYFAPRDTTFATITDPGDPTLFYASGCEWHIDPTTHHAIPLGVITHDQFHFARYAQSSGKTLLILTPDHAPPLILERLAPGNYRPTDLPTLPSR